MNIGLSTIRTKTLRDLWLNRGRTILVALSVAVGVLGVGLVTATWDLLTTDLRARYAETHPAHVEISVPAGVQPDDLHGLESVPGITAVQGRYVFNGRYRNGAGYWETMEFVAFPDPQTQTVNVITPESGAWPPARRTVVVERASLDALGLEIGDPLIVDALGREMALTIAGTAHQQDKLASVMTGSPVAIVDVDTLAQLQGHDRLNTIYLTVDDLGQCAAVAAAARERLERAGYATGRVTLRDPQVHPAQEVLDVLFLVMGVLGVLTLALSSFLVTNTINALMAQQIKQIGVMKAIGADTGLVARAYGQAVLAYGLLGTILAVPFAGHSGYRLAAFLAGRLNIDLFPYRPSVPGVVVMIAVGLAVPFLAAAKPLWDGARLTVREAIADYGLTPHPLPHRRELWAGIVGARPGPGQGVTGPWIIRPQHPVSRLPRPGRPRGAAPTGWPLADGGVGTRGVRWNLALRNALRVPTRLILALITLALGGAIFIAVLSTDQSFNRTVDNLINGQYGMDALVAFSREERISRVVPLVEMHPEVAHAEAWYFAAATMQVPSGQEVEVTVQAGPSDTEFYQPHLEAGRWLRAGDTHAIVVNRKWAEEEGLQLGDTVTLDLGGGAPASEWVVVGIAKDLVRRQTGVLVLFDALDGTLKRTDRTVTLEVQFTAHEPAAQRRIGNELSDLLAREGIDVFSVMTMGQIESQVTSLYRILVIFLLVMAVLVAIVGGLGLMGMMSINVIERRKEIGVMRAIGAGTGDILRIFWGESIAIALLSFGCAALLSYPLARALARLVGVAFINAPLDFAYAVPGLAYWLAIVLAIGTLASILPALSAANLSVRETLNYE